MAPGKAPTSMLASSQGKRQQSISSFFTQKSAPPTTSSSSQPSIDTVSGRISSTGTGTGPHGGKGGQSNGVRSEEVEDEEDEEPVVSAAFRNSLKRHLESGDGNAGAASSAMNTGKAADEGQRRKVRRVESGDENAGSGIRGTDSSRPLAKGARTAKYVFSSSPATASPGGDVNGAGDEPEDEQETEEEKRRKERLHQKFVKRLGRPESMAEIKRRNFVLEDHTGGEAGEGEAGEDEGDEEEDLQKQRTKKKAVGKKGAAKLTPMERQIVDMKRSHLDAVLAFEVGYKFRFFGEDARIAAKVLGIVCIPGKMRYDEHPSEAHLDRFASASFPVARLHVHVKRLVAAGHKVGVVRQIETAALKAAGDNRNTPFVRKLTNLYTKGTYIDDIEGLQGQSAETAEVGAPATGYLLALTEILQGGNGADERVLIGLVAVQPATGDIIYDTFEDAFMRADFESRLMHIAPCEFLVVGDLSAATDKVLRHLSGDKHNVFGDQARIERVEKGKTAAAEAFSHVSKFYAEKMKDMTDAAAGTEDSQGAAHILDQAHQLSEPVTVCLSAMITHLKEYGLEHVFDLTHNFQPFSARSHMLLNGNTLASLEIYRNQTDNSQRGSLFWCLDRTKTRFGQRLLRKWVGRPLLDKARLEDRIAAVDELKDQGQSPQIEKLKRLLSSVKTDLEKSLIRIYYKKCTRPELLAVLQTLQRVSGEYVHVKSAVDAGFGSSIINAAVATLPKVAEPVLSYLERINLQAARDNDRYMFFREAHESESITDHKMGIASVEADLDTHKAEAAATLRKKNIAYVTCAGIDFLIEVENTQLKHVPASWVKISGTKKVSRFHTPDIIRFLRERDQHKEALAAACDDAFAALLAEMADRYEIFRDFVQALATLDCLFSLADVASQPGYVAPTFSDEPGIHIVQGRHPMVEQLLLDAYVPNDIDIAGRTTAGKSSTAAIHPSALLITGPNMGGKSSYVRQTALIAILAQIGSHVPAQSARLGLLDAVFTRMGAQDNMLRGESTFMVELAETAELLRAATPRSLVLLDELGRGTSTHDGGAIAEAVLRFVVDDVGCACLFVTHYQALARLAGWAGGEAATSSDMEVKVNAGEVSHGALRQLRNVHMRFEEVGEDVTFLYEVGEGVAHRSYGLNVARLAHVPRCVLDVARIKSGEMELGVRRKRVAALFRNLGKMAAVRDGDGDWELETLGGLVDAMGQL